MTRAAACVRAALVLAAAFAPAGGALSASEPREPRPLRAGDAQARLGQAALLRAQDLRSLGAALTAIGAAKDGTADDVAFLAEFLAEEHGRALRLLAAESAHRIDAGRAAALLLDRAGRTDDPACAARCVEAAGMLAGRDRAATFVDLVGHRSGLVASSAADALARIAAKADAPAIAERGLAHAWPSVAEHCAWTVLDVLGDRAKAGALFLPKSADVPLAAAARVAAAQAALADPEAAPHKWTLPFAAARKSLTAAPRSVAMRGMNPAMQKWMDDGAAWLRDSAPAENWVVCAALKAVSYRSDGATRLDADAARLDLSLDDVGLPPPRFANVVFRHAAVLWRRQIGEPSGRRAWEAAVAESFDLCAAGKVDGAGERTATREKFVERALEGRPWEAR